MRGPEQDLFDPSPHGLCLDYSLYFQFRRLRDIAPTFLSPLLSKRVGNILLLRGAPPPMRPRESCQDQAPNTEGIPRESCQEQASDTEGIPEFQPAWVSTPEELPNFPPERESTLEEPPSFILEGDQESSSGPKMESRLVLKVKLLFHQKAKETSESTKEESSSPKDAPSEDEQEVVTISDLDGTGQEAPGPSTSQSTEVSS